MSIHNSGLGPSQQREHFVFQNFGLALTSGDTGVLALVPFPCVMDAAQIATFSVESNPNLILTVTRFITGFGVTTWNLGTTFAARSFGTSGALNSGVSLPASGSSLLQLMTNDVVGYVVGGGSTAGIFGVAGDIVLRPIQDVRTNLFTVE